MPADARTPAAANALESRVRWIALWGAVVCAAIAAALAFGNGPRVAFYLIGGLTMLALAVAFARRSIRLGPNVWGLSSRWLCVCPWNGSEFWIQLPLVGLIVGTEHVELMLGVSWRTVNIDVRWSWRA